MSGASKSFPDLLTEAADRIDDLPRAHVKTLLRRAALRLKAAEASGVENLEHVPVYSYHLLRRLDQAPVRITTLHGIQDEEAVQFLISRGLAKRTDLDLTITPVGRATGAIENDRARSA